MYNIDVCVVWMCVHICNYNVHTFSTFFTYNAWGPNHNYRNEYNSFLFRAAIL